MQEPEPRNVLIGSIEDEDTFLRISVSRNQLGETLIALRVGDIDARRRDHVLALRRDQFEELRALLAKTQDALGE